MTNPSHEPPPIAWTLAGSDSGGGAGIQADLATFRALGVHGCSVVTAVTAQSTCEVRRVAPVPADQVTDQVHTLADDLPPRAIKTGMLGSGDVISAIVHALDSIDAPIVCDPVLRASTSSALLDDDGVERLRSELLPRVALFTPNLPEAERLLGRPLESDQDIEAAAEELLSWGPQSVLLKGGHRTGEFSQDFWISPTESFWLTSDRVEGAGAHGTGCVLSAAVAAGLAQGLDLPNSLVVAKALVRQAIRNARRIGAGDPVATPSTWPDHPDDLPWLTPTAHAGRHRPRFPEDPRLPYGLYPIVDSLDLFQDLLPLGLRVLQLRIKNPSAPGLDQTVEEAIRLARGSGAALYINDHWKLAIRHGAHGVHLGQDDLDPDAIKAIRQAGMRLGLSTHSYAELARAIALRPTYVAIGTVYPTTSKSFDFVPLGVRNFSRLRSLSHAPTVAIGGIHLDNAEPLIQAGADGCAVISEIADSPNLTATAQNWNRLYSIQA